MRKREKSEKGEKRINFLLILIILILLAALGVVAYKGFTVKQVQVEGTDLYPDETIRQWVLNDDYSWNTLYVFFTISTSRFIVASIPNLRKNFSLALLLTV